MVDHRLNKLQVNKGIGKNEFLAPLVKIKIKKLIKQKAYGQDQVSVLLTV